MNSAPAGVRVRFNFILMETYIVKRDGKHEVFAIEKIKAAIAKSFLASGAFATEEIMTGVLAQSIFSGGRHRLKQV
ncbi:MAG: ATP cone domain-containing protein [Bacteroidaceae bacterium]|nr:ATP cone domain-containing protein [Bacteroidaceae bacterium]